jgi:hypothetical protein
MKTSQKSILPNLCFLATFIFSGVAYPGFEMGNGKKIVKNTPGNYEIIIPDKLEAGFSNKFTELIAPLFDGTPRAKLQINIVKNDLVKSLFELVNSVPGDNTWTQASLAGFDGIRNETVLPNKVHQLEYRLFFKEFEVLVISVEGVPGYSSKSNFEMLQRALDTLKIKTK